MAARTKYSTFLTHQREMTIPDGAKARYQTLHGVSRTIGSPIPQEKAFPNSGILETTPLIRYSSGECGFVIAFARLLSGRSSPQPHSAMPMKQPWSAVNPSIDFRSC